MSPASSPPPSHGSPSPIPTSSPTNRLALISMVLGAVAPAVALVAVVAHFLQASTLSTFLAGILGQWTVPIGVVTIICGHLALRQAKRYPPAQARRTVALSGLVLGYGTLVAFLGFIAYILATFH